MEAEGEPDTAAADADGERDTAATGEPLMDEAGEPLAAGERVAAVDAAGEPLMDEAGEPLAAGEPLRAGEPEAEAAAEAETQLRLLPTMELVRRALPLTATRPPSSELAISSRRMFAEGLMAGLAEAAAEAAGEEDAASEAEGEVLRDGEALVSEGDAAGEPLVETAGELLTAEDAAGEPLMDVAGEPLAAGEEEADGDPEAEGDAEPSSTMSKFPVPLSSRVLQLVNCESPLGEAAGLPLAEGDTAGLPLVRGEPEGVGERLCAAAMASSAASRSATNFILAASVVLSVAIGW
jgi:hypothetical protein